MSYLELTNQSVLEPILYKKEQGSILKEPLKGSDTFFVKEKEGKSYM
ncbi:hypothetical protein QRD38_16330 [Leptospira weilii]|nr:hypothetical protein [Leptospira weilii]MDL5247317.1 hypothetical protein [Leptospira weilii]